MHKTNVVSSVLLKLINDESAL